MTEAEPPYSSKIGYVEQHVPGIEQVLRWHTPVLRFRLDHDGLVTVDDVFTELPHLLGAVEADNVSAFLAKISGAHA